MSLIDRLLHLDPDESRNMQVHTFGSCIHELIRGRASRADLISWYNMVGDDITELDVMIANGQGLDDVSRFQYAQEIEDCFINAESGIPGYTTHAEIAAKLNNPASGKPQEWRYRKPVVVAAGPIANGLTSINCPAVTTQGTLSDHVDTEGNKRRCLSAGSNNSDAGWFTASSLTARGINPDITFKFRSVETATRRVWVGLFASDPMASDVPTISHFALRLSSAPAIAGFVVSHSDGTTQMLEPLIAAADTLPHTIRIVGDQPGSRWGYSFDGASVSWINTNIPAANDTLVARCQVRTLQAVAKNLDFWFMEGTQDK